MTSEDLYQQALTVGSVPAMHAADPVTGHRVAIAEDERRLTWQELDERSTRVAAGLIRMASGRAIRSPCTRETGSSTSSSCTG